MERTREIGEFVDASGDFAQQPAVRACLLSASLGQRRVVVTRSPTLHIVLALAMADDVERERADIGHRVELV